MTPRQRADLDIAAARSAVATWERCWQDIPDGAGTLDRARANLAMVERRYAGLPDDPVAEPRTPLPAEPRVPDPPPDTSTLVGQAKAALATAIAATVDPQRCLICGHPGAFGFGLPPRPTTWSCLLHRAQVDALFRPSPYVPLPRSRGNPRRDAKPPPNQGRLL